VSGTILVTGATGKTGAIVARRLRDLGATVRTAARSGADVHFDWSDPVTHDEALHDVARVYVVAPPAASDPVESLVPFVERALRAGLRRVVLLSSSAIEDSMPGLGAVERAVRERVPEWTLVKPSWFMQNFSGRWHPHGASLADDGVVVTCTGTGRIGFVDVEDIAEVAVRALSDEVPHNAAHIVTGPEALSYDDVIAILSRTTGRTLHHLHVDEAEAENRWIATGIPQAYAKLLVALDVRIRTGAENRVTDTVLRVTGRPPRSFEDFARATFAPSLAVEHASC
jgi:uncharacterized protein YbjT (DUF2867 family)